MDWLMNTAAGLAARLVLAIGVFVLLAGIDLAIHRRQATRWREYLILATAVLAAMAYGVANDQITLTLSPHYFYYHKGRPVGWAMASRWSTPRPAGRQPRWA